jgi:amino-acid N-acetyltransferase
LLQVTVQQHESRVQGGVSVTLRPATSADLDAVESLLASNKLPLDGVEDFLHDFIIAEGDGIAGVIGMERHGAYGLLRSAAVRDDVKGAGIGRRLVDRLLASAREDGITDVYLLTTTAEKYFPAFGFERIERSAIPAELSASKELQGACPDTAIVMHLSLSDGENSH